MAVEFTWDAPDRAGNQDCWFWHGADHIQMHACDVIAKSWRDTTARDLWAQTEATKIIARREYEATDECKLARAREDVVGLQAALDGKQVEVAALEAKVK